MKPRFDTCNILRHSLFALYAREHGSPITGTLSSFTLMVLILIFQER